VPEIAPAGLAEPRPRFDGIGRIAVLRGGGLGDLIMTLPAVEALAAAYPDAEIVLLGTSLHAELLADRPSPFATVEVLPAWPGVCPGPPDRAAQTDFVNRVRARTVDLAVQVHGGGRHANPLLLELGARHTVGTQTPDAVTLERTLPYRYYQHESLRALEVVGLAGAMPTVLEPRIATPGVQPRSSRVVVHAGASDPRRRWLPERFAEVAYALARAGLQVVVIGDIAEADLADQVVSGAHRAGASRDRVLSLAGRLAIGELVDLLASSFLVVANDSGPRHLAQAVGTPTVGLYWFGNVINYGPLSRGRHRIQIGWTTACPTCGADCTQVGWTAERCPHDDSLITDIGTAAVLSDAFDLLHQSGAAE
jgi:ADP-heptose:LPS heptosyltransferase